MYTLWYKKSVEKDLRKLPKSQLQAIVRKIQALATDPRPVSSIKLQGSENLFRMRHADYRIIYQINDSEVTVLVIKVGHRREVYKDL